MIELYEEYVQACNKYNSIPMFTFRDWAIEMDEYDNLVGGLFLLNLQDGYYG